jgi:GWxTD domain-containing protein
MSLAKTKSMISIHQLSLLSMMIMIVFITPVIAGIDSLQVAQKIIKADKYFNENKIDSAKALYISVLDLDSKNVKALLGIAKVEYTQDEFEDKVNNSASTMEIIQQNQEVHSELNYAKFNQALYYLKMINKIETDDPDCCYFMGIIHKEMIKLKITADRSESYKIAKDCFEKIIKKDSCYLDVLLQYAQLLCEHGKYEDCIKMLKHFIKSKPGFTEGFLCLDRILNHIYDDEGYADTKEYFLGNDDVDIYSIAFTERKRGNIDEAIVILNKLLDKPSLQIPVVLVYRELLKCDAAENNYDMFISAYNKMMNNLLDEKDCDLVYDDLKYLATKQEIIKYNSSDYIFKKGKWFPVFWNHRTAAGVESNNRILEHYKRLVYAEKKYYHDRSKFSFLKPTESYNSNQEFTDQGYIYIKYGEPDEINKTKEEDQLKEVRLQTLGSLNKRPHEMDRGRNYSSDAGMKSAGKTARESWLYLPSANNKKRIFHFFGFSKTLVSAIYDDVYINAIRDWDPCYNQIVYDNRDPLSLNPEFRDNETQKTDLGDSLKKELLTGITQERSEENISYKQIKLNYEVYKFKSENDKTEILIGYFLPIPMIFKELADSVNETTAITGYNFYDGDWNLLTEKRDSVVYEKKTDGLRPKVKFVSFQADTGKINSTIYCNPIGKGISCFNKDIIDVPGYPIRGLCSSDIMLSVIDNKATGNGKKWNKYYLLPSPTNKWSLKKPINLYYEIYNLKKNLEGKTLFRLEYAFRFKGSNENLLTKIFGNNNEVVSTEYSQSGKETESHEYLSFDLNRLTPGTYVMEITVKDMNANKNITLKKEVELF